jgi:hypothetical protein
VATQLKGAITTGGPGEIKKILIFWCEVNHFFDQKELEPDVTAKSGMLVLAVTPAELEKVRQFQGQWYNSDEIDLVIEARMKEFFFLPDGSPRFKIDYSGTMWGRFDLILHMGSYL